MYLATLSHSNFQLTIA